MQGTSKVLIINLVMSTQVLVLIFLAVFAFHGMFHVYDIFHTKK